MPGVFKKIFMLCSKLVPLSKIFTAVILCTPVGDLCGAVLGRGEKDIFHVDLAGYLVALRA